ncbi:MAG: hypothetical protein IJY47_02290 [Clostridia bacterium]|nr:hypothetical protein [Clostridia bacterium]
MARSYRNRREREETLRRIAVWGGLLFILAVARGSFFARLSFLPATPDLLLCALVAIALLDSVPVAAVAGIGGGFLADALGGTGFSLSPVLYLLVVLTVSGMAEKMMAGVWSWLLMMIPALLLRAGATFLGILLTYESFTFGYALGGILLPEGILTLLLGFPLYWIVMLCVRLCGDRRDRSLR